MDSSILIVILLYILNVTRALLFQSSLPLSLWSFALLHATLLINCIPTPFLHNKSPYEMLHSQPYDINLLLVFGCLCYISTITAHRTKLASWAHSSIFLGFKSHTKGYLVFNLHTCELVVSRNVVLYEDQFLYLSNSHQTLSSDPSLPSSTSFSPCITVFYSVLDQMSLFWTQVCSFGPNVFILKYWD